MASARVSQLLLQFLPRGRKLFNWLLMRFTLRRLLLVVALCSAALALYRVSFRRDLYIRQLAPGESVIDKCFAVCSLDAEIRCTGVFGVCGALPTYDSLLISLYLIESGKVREVSSITVSPPDYFMRSVDLRIALCEVKASAGPLTVLGVGGSPPGAAGSGTYLDAKRPLSGARVLAGRIGNSVGTIAYIEGKNPYAEHGMDVIGFAKKNQFGKFIVITAGVAR